MIFILLLSLFIVFVGLGGSVLRKKLYKRLLSLSLSFNSLIVFAMIMAHTNNNMQLKIFCICAIFSVSLVVSCAFYICYEAKRRKT